LCTVDLEALADVCPVDVPQETLVTITGENTDFVGTYAFYGPNFCAHCLSLSPVAVFVFAEPPPFTSPFAFSLSAGEHLTLHLVSTVAGTEQQEPDQTFYRDGEGNASRLESVTLSVTDAPEVADFEPPFSAADLPHLRFDIDSAGPGLEIAGVVDAVYCEAAAWTPPCE
jgi:hypothetical protein